MRFLVVDAHVTALLLSGRITEAIDVAERFLGHATDLPGVAPLLASAIAGRAALGAGQVATAESRLGPVAEALFAAGESNGSAYRYQLPRTIAIALRGSPVDVSGALKALQQRRHPSWRFLDYESAIAHAWVTACEGAVSAAITIVLSAAETARDDGQFGAEVLCLQVATQLGDRSCAPRLSELQAVVEGPRVGLAARFAAALRFGRAAELASVSEDFERMGDLVAAIDAASHAAIMYRRNDLRGSAYRVRPVPKGSRIDAAPAHPRFDERPAHRYLRRLPEDGEIDAAFPPTGKTFAMAQLNTGPSVTTSARLGNWAGFPQTRGM